MNIFTHTNPSTKRLVAVLTRYGHMDTVHNIGSVIVGSNSGAPGEHASGSDIATGQQHTGPIPGSEVSHPDDRAEVSSTRHLMRYRDSASFTRRSPRQEFLSRPNWLFTHNENVLFCTALTALRFDDQNNVPRKFIEEKLSEKLVYLDTPWPSGNKFITDTISEMQNEPSKLAEKQNREYRSRQKEFYKHNQLGLKQAIKNFEAATSPEAKQTAELELEAAKNQATMPAETIDAPMPSPEEIALVELQTKIVRRLQGQTDRVEMAEQLAGKAYQGEHDVVSFFQKVQDEILIEIKEKHDEIAQDREKVDAKSKQSRRRRRNQVSNGTTMSGSATRVRFTNREIAMLINWIYTYPKSEWSSKIYHYYILTGNARSAEHVRDKMRDLVAKSEDQAHGGLTTMKVRSVSNFFSRPGDVDEIHQLSLNDLQGFKYPEGRLEHIPGGRYFDEERSIWVDGPLPAEYAQRYKDEITRIHRVVEKKVERAREKMVGFGTNVGNFDSRLTSPAQLGASNDAYSTTADFALAASDRELPTGPADISLFWDKEKSVGQPGGVDEGVDSVAAFASAALAEGKSDSFLNLDHTAQKPEINPSSEDPLKIGKRRASSSSVPNMKKPHH